VKASQLSRSACRSYAEKELGMDKMVSAYEALFHDIVDTKYLPHAI